MPNLKKISRKASVLIVTAVISCGVTYIVCSSKYKDKIDELNDRISTLEKAKLNADVTQRISKQMEDIAYQAKSIADTALQRAEFERGKAVEQTHRAEQERHAALLAKDKADNAEREAHKQAAKAEEERVLAQEARDVAEIEKAKADTLSYISLGRSLAQNSIAQYNAGETDLARLLAYASYTYTKEYDGSPYQQDVFTALLYSANSARTKIASLKGSIRAIECVNTVTSVPHKDSDILVASDYGEIYRLSPRYKDEHGNLEGYSSTPLFNDNRYVFRDMCVKKGTLYALDADGRIVVLDINKDGKQQPVIYSVAGTIYPKEIWSHLLQKKNGQMIAVGEHQIVWVDPNTRGIVRQHYLSDNIVEAGIGDGKLLIYTDKKYYMYREGVPAEWDMTLPKQCIITAYYYLKNNRLHVLGADNGGIYLYDRDGNLKYTFPGHSGPITHIESAGWCLVTSSYDKTVRIWDINNLGDLIAPLEVKYTEWPLIFDLDKSVNGIRLGFANGDIEAIRYSADENAASVKRHINREFTPQEWLYYIGDGVPYRTFR